MELLFDNFDQLADAPNGVQKLRELILKLAVRGKLVEQDPNDESVNILLRKIEKRKNSILGNIKKTKLDSKKTDKIKLYEIPKSWLWTFLDECSLITMGQSPKSIFYNENKEGLPFYQGKADFGVLFPTPRKWCTVLQKIAVKGDVLISVRAPVGPTNLCQEESCIGRGLAAISTLNVWNEYYLLYAIRAQESTISKMGAGSTFSAIKHSQLKAILLPLPPLNEQKRIVAKVDQLMAMCDQLEKQKEQRDKKRISLNQAALNKLLTSRDPSAFQKHWQRIVANFDLLYDVPENVAELKKAVLQLAVMGKLVPQNPYDEPASELLKHIQAEKNQLIREGKIKKEKPLPPITEDGIPYELPKEWEWTRLGSLIKISSGDNLTSEQMVKSGKIPVYGGNGITGYHNNFNVEKETIVIGRVGFYCGSVHLTGKKAWVTDNAFRTYFSEKNTNRDFLIWLLKATNLKKDESATAQPVISGRKIYPILVGIPPLNEQKRIVAKVDALMKLCDELEEKLKQSKQESERLLEAVVQRIINQN